MCWLYDGNVPLEQGKKQMYPSPNYDMNKSFQ